MKAYFVILMLGVVQILMSQNRPQTPKPPFNYITEEVILVNSEDKNTLAGTLSSPNKRKDIPVLVMITGSGAQNRDEEIFGHKPFAVIADDFAKNGIATLRLDDRGVGGSSEGKSTDTTENFAKDTNAAVNFLAEKGFTHIGLLGHSEGGMIAPMVASRNEKVKFLIILAGLGISGEELLIQQNEMISKASRMDERVIMKNKGINQRLYQFTKNYKGENLKEDLKKIMKTELPEMQDFFIHQQVNALASPWMRYFLSFDPEIYFEKVKIPVLALNGSLDMQVSAKENLGGIKKALEKAGNINYELVEIEGVNHLFQTAKVGTPLEYAVLEETFSPKVLEIMKKWIKKLH